ncbi:thioredoxin family protein [Flavobacterium sp. SM15]|uniref:thioredoxin family protein n=1 Tax=Flavobacterium sp. SM15 TaxID=2908005 RepID=UPI001EDB4D71|nr:thioredoxin family protein [Flavobacterium sp. SM15]MCG2611747.1 thioredoxin family protein [Flavobacterium sp. SM15]
MKWKLMTFLLLFSLLMTAQATKHLTFKESLEKSKTENKNLLLYFSGSDWCAPCVKFKKQFILTDAFAKFSEESLILFNADFPRLKKNQLPETEAKENDILAEKYNSKGYFPMILLLNPKGEILKKWEQLPTETLEEFIAKLK